MSDPRARPVRFGVLGCGTIAYWAHLRALGGLRGARLVAAADPDAAARDRAGRLAGIPVYEGADELLARDDVDAVVVCAPTHLHADLAVAVCETGRHLYLEKPIASSAADAIRVVDAAARAGVTAAMGFNRRLHPLCEQARRLVAGGSLGRVVAIQTALCEPTPTETMPGWKRRRSTGGGALLDLASHHVDLVRWLLADEVEEVEARIDSSLSEDDTAWLRLSTRSGVEVQSVFSFRAARSDVLELVGERGTLRLDRHRPALTLRTGRRLGYGVRARWVVPSGQVAAWWPRRAIRPSWDPSYRRSLAAFVTMLHGGQGRLSTLSDGVRALAVVLAAEASSLAGEPARVASAG